MNSNLVCWTYFCCYPFHYLFRDFFLGPILAAGARLSRIGYWLRGRYNSFAGMSWCTFACTVRGWIAIEAAFHGLQLYFARGLNPPRLTEVHMKTLGENARRSFVAPIVLENWNLRRLRDQTCRSCALWFGSTPFNSQSYRMMDSYPRSYSS